MKVYDFHIHLTSSSEIKKSTKNEYFISVYDHHRWNFKKHMENGNFIFNNEDLFLDDDFNTMIQHLKKDWPNANFTSLVNFRKDSAVDTIDKSVEHGLTAIKFHPYEQRISNTDLSDVLKIAQYAERKKLIICIDTSYGTSKMFTYDNIKLAAFLSEFIKKVPLILLHSGGLRVFEAMLLSDLQNNIYLETSFSLSYYKGATLEKDFAFAFKKIGTERVIFGSDFPYVTLEQSISDMTEFLEKYEFKAQDIDNIMYHNAMNLSEKL